MKTLVFLECNYSSGEKRIMCRVYYGKLKKRFIEETCIIPGETLLKIEYVDIIIC